MRRKSRYIHELRGWPKLSWNQESLANTLASVRHKQGRLLGRMEALGFPLQQEAVLQTLTEDVVKSSDIEGERLEASHVRSSIARRLGIDAGGVQPTDRQVEGVVEMMLDATRNYEQPLTADRLFGWHASLFPSGRSGMRKVRVGVWRDDSTGPMQVVSGPVGRERMHFEAPEATRLEREMKAFLDWFNEVGRVDVDDVLKAALAHFWFVTIHPLALARSEHSSQRFYSMSAEIRQERNDYYEILEHTQKGPLDVTPWMAWFLECLGRAIDSAQTTLAAVLQKARFWQVNRDAPINERQRLMLNRLLDGFEGKLSSSKWAAIEKCSPDTALRDISDLVERGILEKDKAGGRSTSYSLVEAG